VFLLSWALLQDPFSDLEADLVAADAPDELGQAEVRGYRWRDQAQDAIAELTGRPVAELFAGVPDDGFPVADLEARLLGTEWEPLLWAAPWLWRLSGNAFLDRCPAEEQPEAEPWSRSAVFRLAAEHREALRIMRAVDAFDIRLTGSPSDCARGAIEAALGPPSGRLSTLLDLRVVDAAPGQHT
jgi:hypothetical protein